jgi:micrococcal nuclease
MYKYKCKLVRVIDGDTVDAMVDLGFDIWVKKRIRFTGIDTPEIRTRNKEEKKRGLLAKARVVDVLAENENEFLLTSHGVGKYGRCLGELRVEKNYIRSEKYHGKIINEMLVKEGWAKKI